MDDPSVMALLASANRRLIRTVDALDDDAFARPSDLPDWTVGHVVAHLALNGEALAGALSAVADGVTKPMYASQESRDTDIATLAASSASELRSRLMASTELFDRAIHELRSDQLDTMIDRTPGTPIAPARATVSMRLGEVEIHHADLGVGGYFAKDWPIEFVVLLLDSRAKRRWPTPFRAHAHDVDRTWSYGDGDPTTTVSGLAADLAWWLTGRGDGSTLTADGGELPKVAAW